MFFCNRSFFFLSTTLSLNNAMKILLWICGTQIRSNCTCQRERSNQSNPVIKPIKAEVDTGGSSQGFERTLTSKNSPGKTAVSERWGVRCRVWWGRRNNWIRNPFRRVSCLGTSGIFLWSSLGAVRGCFMLFLELLWIDLNIDPSKTSDNGGDFTGTSSFFKINL